MKAENIAEKLDWMSRIRACIEAKGGASEESFRSAKDSVSSKESDSSVMARSTYDGPAVSRLVGILSCFLLEAVMFLHALVGVKFLIIVLSCFVFSSGFFQNILRIRQQF